MKYRADVLRAVRSFLFPCGAVMLALASACGADGGAVAQRDEDVVSAQQFLKRYGYLPSAELRAQHPGIAFIVDEEVEDGVLDDATARALQAYQERSGLEATGVPDAETLSAMATPRCGNLDADVHADDLHEKFAFIGEVDTFDYSRTSATVRVRQYPAGSSAATRTKIDSDLEAVTLEISRRTGFWLSRITAGTPDISVWFYSTNVPAGSGCAEFDGELAHARATRVCVNTGYTFDYGSGFGSNYDFQSVLFHELGHSIGMHHAPAPAIMQPSMPASVERIEWHREDLRGLWAKYGKWVADYEGMRVRDMTWGPTNVLYVISDHANGAGGYEIWTRTGASRSQTNSVLGAWEEVGGAASRIAHDGKRAWAVNANNVVYYRNNDDTAWVNTGGCARDVDGNANEGLQLMVTCDGEIAQATIFGWLPITTGLNARRVAVHKEAARAYVVLADDTIRRLVFGGSNGVEISTFPGKLREISAGFDGTLWGTNAAGNIYTWESQPAVADVPALSRWVRYPGSASAVTSPAWSEPTVAPFEGRPSDIRDRYTN